MAHYKVAITSSSYNNDLNMRVFERGSFSESDIVASWRTLMYALCFDQSGGNQIVSTTGRILDRLLARVNLDDLQRTLGPITELNND